jgi:branched-chain amino acid transport system substrate-binding protein
VAKPKTAVILFENTLFGTSSAQESEKLFKDLGIQILFKEGYEHGAVDFKPLLIKVKNANPDLVYMISYLMDASLIIRQFKELDFNPKLFVGGGGGFVLAEFYDNVGKLAEGVFAATLWVPNLPYPKAMDYYTNYKKIYGKVTDFRGAAAYACMFVTADALQRAKTLTREDVRQALTATNMMTIFGRVKFISYGKKTNQNRLPTYLAQWLNGKMECVWPKECAMAKYHFPHRPWNER